MKKRLTKWVWAVIIIYAVWEKQRKLRRSAAW